MHRVATTAGDWNNSSSSEIVFIEQDPAPIVILTAADTDIQAIASAWARLPAGFPAVRVANILGLGLQITIDSYAEAVLERARVIVIRLIGGVSYWPYGIEVVEEVAQRTGAQLIILPGDDRPDVALFDRSTLPLTELDRLWRYFIEGGVDNIQQALYFIAERCLGLDYPSVLPAPVPKVFEYKSAGVTGAPNLARVGIIFYRAHYLAGNTKPIDLLCECLAARGLEPVPIAVSSLRDPDVQAELVAILQPKEGKRASVLLNTTSFSLIDPAPISPITPVVADETQLWQQLDVPIIQVILSGGGEADWLAQMRGLSPRDTAMNVALPEVDGRIIGRAISFKAVQSRHPDLQTEVVGYQPRRDRVEFVADLAANWAALRSSVVKERRVALILANYPTRDGRLANGVGLDTPASCIEILKAMVAAGYTLPAELPQTGDELIDWLTRGITNDPEGRAVRRVNQYLGAASYQAYFRTLPEAVQTAVVARWGEPPTADIPIAGIQLGQIFIGIQPARGYDLDPSLNYHAADLEPTHDYLGFYYWLRSSFQTQAIVHVGKHGNLEWLPGKSVALADTCYPEIALGAIPHLYPFIVNDPGEGSQAKRRSAAVIIDHLTPPMTRAELYGDLANLENLVDEYYEALDLDPDRSIAIQSKIVALLKNSNLDRDLGLQSTVDRLEDGVLNRLDRSLCELKEAQIRDGLHILGTCPAGTQLRDTIAAIARHPQPGRMGLTQAIALYLDLDFDPLRSDPATELTTDDRAKLAQLINHDRPVRNIGQAIVILEECAAGEIDRVLNEGRGPKGSDRNRAEVSSACVSVKIEGRGELNHVSKINNLDNRKYSIILDKLERDPSFTWIANKLLPDLQQTTQEIDNLLSGLAGKYIPSGPSGAPTRGRAEVLPTGRNFYSVDIRAIPTETAWDVGRKSADLLIDRYTQEQGEYPTNVAISIWGTSTMRTGGDDLAQALALIGVRPVWDSSSRRVVDFEILPLNILGRPRVDVTLRISGFFRDAFPNLIDLFDRAVAAVAILDEPKDLNPIAATIITETQALINTGLEPKIAARQSSYRVFGAKSGAYGAGLQGLIDSQNWQDINDLAAAYRNWSSYAYAANDNGIEVKETFDRRLAQIQVVLQNQDNREHDLLDSDDYYQFQGGLTAAVKAISGTQPQTYFGDRSVINNPKLRSLNEEIARVYRSRVINPKWIAGAMRHGYQGAREMAATMDFLFAYDATTNCVADHMYQGIADAYIFDPTVRDFIQKSNPWALRDIAERLLEAHQRDLWQNVDRATLDKLQSIALDAEGDVESRLIDRDA